MNLHRYIRGLLSVGFVVLAFLPFNSGNVNAQATDLFVSPSGSGTDCSQSNPCDAGQAMTNAMAGDTIYFMGGTYTGTNDPYLIITEAVSLFGGWDGAASGEVVIDPSVYPTTIDGEDARALIKVDSISVAGDLITISGFTLQKGYDAVRGGAIHVASGRVDIVGNTFLNNTAGSYGGAIYVGSNHDVQILSNSFIDNEVTYGGGSILVGSSSATTLIEGNSFTGGNASYGTAIHNDSCSLVINGNLFVDNPGSSTIDLYSNSYGSTISNNFIVRSAQTAIDLAGVNTNPYQVVNNTIVDAGTGISPSNSLVNVVNNIISGANSSITNSSGTLTGSNNLFFDNINDLNPLTDPVYDDPVFVDPSADNFHLDGESPAVDAGIVVTLDEDYDGDERPIGEGFDIGADEVKSGYLAFLPLVLK